MFGYLAADSGVFAAVFDIPQAGMVVAALCSAASLPARGRVRAGSVAQESSSATRITMTAMSNESSQPSGPLGRIGFASKRRELSHETSASATLENVQKSSVVPSWDSTSSAMRSGQSPAPISQKRHPWQMGRGRVCVPAFMAVMMRCASGVRKLLSVRPMVLSGSGDSGTVVYLFGDGDEDASYPYMHWIVEPGSAAGPLTAREVETLRYRALGWDVPHIATELVLSSHAVRNHSTNLRRKLDVGSTFEAVVVAIRLGLLTFNDGVLQLDEARGADRFLSRCKSLRECLVADYCLGLAPLGVVRCALRVESAMNPCSTGRCRSRLFVHLAFFVRGGSRWLRRGRAKLATNVLLCES